MPDAAAGTWPSAVAAAGSVHDEYVPQASGIPPSEAEVAGRPEHAHAASRVRTPEPPRFVHVV